MQNRLAIIENEKTFKMLKGAFDGDTSLVMKEPTHYPVLFVMEHLPNSYKKSPFYIYLEDVLPLVKVVESLQTP